MPAIDIDRDTAHEAAKHELSKPIYPKDSLSERFIDWLNTTITHLLIKGSTVPGGWFTISILLIMVAVAVFIVIRISRNTLRTRRGSDHPLFGPTELSSAEHRATAERYAAAGDWAAAIRHRLRAVARQLEESGVLNPMPGRTANELARDTGIALPQLSAELTSAARSFNDVTYGELPGTEAGYRMIVDLDDHLRSRSPNALPDAPQPVVPDSWAPIR